ncbi:MAG: DUF4956 domain-containing protein [Actinomycetota bacterium]|nr:DUF4956 domain-containing protein [Actinomycetota bacterium]
MRVSYGEFLVVLAIDLVAILVLTYALYFRRHQRRDLTLGLMGINVGLFAVSSFSSTTSLSIGFGIGLFALLSVIRLRSTVATQEEIGYYFVALVIGLINGLAGEDRWNVAITLNVVLLAVMFIADHPRMLPHAERCMVVLKGGTRAPGSLKAELEDKLGFEVTRLHVLEIDYAHHSTNVDVRFRTDRPVARRVVPRAEIDVVAPVEAPPEEAAP